MLQLLAADGHAIVDTTLFLSASSQPCELKNFGTPVQYSVFECVLKPRDFLRLQAAVKRIIKADDRVRYYRLCEPCERQIMAIGGVVTQAPATLVV